MARILRWKEKLALGFVALFLSVTPVWLPGTRSAANSGQPRHSRLLSVTGPKVAFGLELLSRKPYVRMTRASRIPLTMPLASGAFVAMAGAGGAPDAAAAASNSTCSDGGGGHGGTTITDGCWRVTCFAGGECVTCGYGTCDEFLGECGC